MPDLEATIDDLVCGNSIQIRRTIDRVLSGYQPGVTIVQAWFTAKESVNDADPGLFQKDISTTDVPGVGHIENDGAGDVDFVVRFDLTEADTLKLGTNKRNYSIKVKAASGDPYTPELGKIECLIDVTQAS